MKKTRFTESQIIGILKQQQTRQSVSDICREHGISQATFYNWKSKYSGLEVNQLKKLKEMKLFLQHQMANGQIQVSIWMKITLKIIWLSLMKKELLGLQPNQNWKILEP